MDANVRNKPDAKNSVEPTIESIPGRKNKYTPPSSSVATIASRLAR